MAVYELEHRPLPEITHSPPQPSHLSEAAQVALPSPGKDEACQSGCSTRRMCPSPSGRISRPGFGSAESHCPSLRWPRRSHGFVALWRGRENGKLLAWTRAREKTGHSDPGGSVSGTKSPVTPSCAHVMLSETPPLRFIHSNPTEPGAKAPAPSVPGPPRKTHSLQSRRLLLLWVAVCRGPGLPCTPDRHRGSQHLPCLPESKGARPASGGNPPECRSVDSGTPEGSVAAKIFKAPALAYVRSPCETWPKPRVPLSGQ